MNNIKMENNEQTENSNPNQTQDLLSNLFGSSNNPQMNNIFGSVNSMLKDINQEMQSNKDSTLSLDQQILELVRQNEIEVIRSGEWMDLAYNNLNKSLSSLIREQAEERAGEELVELQNRKKVEQEERNRKMMSNMLGNVFSMFGAQKNYTNRDESEGSEENGEENGEENLEGQTNEE